MRTYRRWLDGFGRRYQLVIRNVENFSEYVTTPFSHGMVVCFALFWIGMSFGFSLWLAKTVLAKWMNPIYIEKENQKKIFSLASTVEALEQQLESQTLFIDALQQIIKGASSSSSSPRPLVTPAPSAELSSNLETMRSTKNMPILFMPPIAGMITAPFNIKSGHYGIDIVAKDKDPVKAIAAGVVVFAEWSVETGWVIIIQHHNNLVSICKHCAILFKKVGNLVRVGDVVALMGNSGALSTNPHLHFELWNEGIALNPEDLIISSIDVQQ